MSAPNPLPPAQPNVPPTQVPGPTPTPGTTQPRRSPWAPGRRSARKDVIMRRDPLLGGLIAFGIGFVLGALIGPKEEQANQTRDERSVPGLRADVPPKATDVAREVAESLRPEARVQAEAGTASAEASAQEGFPSSASGTAYPAGNIAPAEVQDAHYRRWP
jgi:hypothetical protein